MQQDRQRQAETAPRSVVSGRAPHNLLPAFPACSRACLDSTQPGPLAATAPGMLSGFWGLPPNRLQCVKKHLPCPAWTLPAVADMPVDRTPQLWTYFLLSSLPYSVLLFFVYCLAVFAFLICSLIFRGNFSAYHQPLSPTTLPELSP